MTLSMESSSALAHWYAQMAISNGKTLTPEQWMAKIDAVTKEQIQAIAKKVFQDAKMRVAVIGNISPEEIEF